MTMPPEQTNHETPSITPDGDVNSVTYPDGSHPESDFQPRTEIAPEKSEKKSGFWTRGKIIAGVAIASVLGVAGGTAAVLTSQSQSAPEVPVDPTETPATNPSPEVTQSPSAPEQELTVEALQIPSGLSAEDYAKTLINDRFTKWLMAASFDKKLIDERIAVGNDPVKLSAWYDSKAFEYSQNFADATFIPGWRDHPDLTDIVKNMSAQCAASIEAWIIARNDPVPYVESMSADEIKTINKGPDSRSWSLIVTQNNNSADNRIGGYHPSWIDDNGSKTTYNFETQTIDGHEYISSWTH